jgi:hypothetical protein
MEITIGIYEVNIPAPKGICIHLSKQGLLALLYAIASHISWAPGEKSCKENIQASGQPRPIYFK